MRTIPNIINGQEVAVGSARAAPVFNPATGEPGASPPSGSVIAVFKSELML